MTTAKVDQRQAQFLYRQGEDFVFMDLASYDQITLDAEHVGDADIAAYDKGHDHMMMFADALTDGIVKQFPKKFSK